MPRQIVPIFIIVVTAIFVVIAFVQFFPQGVRGLNQAAKLKAAPSRIYARMLVKYPQPPIYDEEWNMQDIEGVSTYSYTIRSYNGVEITITQPSHAIYDVSFFWGKLDQDGVWKLMNQPPRGTTHALYTVYVKQVVDYQQGDRTIVFPDSIFRSYNIDLSKQDPNAPLQMSATDPSYQVIVNDFLNFGPPEFRAKIASAQARVRAGK
jgi:hypothetical protein